MIACVFCGGKAVCFAHHDPGDSGVPVCNDTALSLNLRGYRLAGLKGGMERLAMMESDAASPRALAALAWSAMKKKPVTTEGEARE